MIPIEHIQFAALTLTGALTLMLVFTLPLKGEGGAAYNRSRWLMVVGTALLPVQFLLQYTLHFRQMGVEPAVLVNLLFFIPAAWVTALSWHRGLRNSMKLLVLLCRVTRDGRVSVKSSDKTCSTRGGNGKTTPVFLLREPHEQDEKAKRYDTRR